MLDIEVTLPGFADVTVMDLKPAMFESFGGS
jgi:hypothetical protein